MSEKINLTGNMSYVTTTNTKLNDTSSGSTMWNGGWVTDNFETYYLDKDMVKRYF
jgi:hypothetical protein